MHDSELSFQSADDTAQTFKIKGHTVKMFSPSLCQVTIECPFPRTNAPTMEQKAFVMNQTQYVVNYMIAEEIVAKEVAGLGIQVLTNHQ